MAPTKREIPQYPLQSISDARDETKLVTDGGNGETQQRNNSKALLGEVGAGGVPGEREGPIMISAVAGASSRPVSDGCTTVHAGGGIQKLSSGVVGS